MARVISFIIGFLSLGVSARADAVSGLFNALN